MATPHTALNQSIDQYVSEINRYKLLTREQEVELAEKYFKEGDLQAAHKLVVSNLRFVVKIAHEYRGYGLKLLDLIQEGNIGLMMAVKKFDASKGYRLISYAVWWIRAYIQNFVIRSWSLVKLGTTQAQRKLFFKLRSERDRADRDAGQGEVASTKSLAKRLKVAEGEVSGMEMRLASRDFSLDAQLEPGARQTHLDLLADKDSFNQEAEFAEEQEREMVRGKVHEAMGELNEKEQYIVEFRLMTDEPKTLQEIGKNFGISRERARQIEGNVIRKIRTRLTGSGLEPMAA
ncbi:MAG: RNA polymerase subunit sigma-70 [Deltaproteobacteria bacterium RIFOXYA12_FULL_58_15]|nr:MAG: RNA polymerase subunit sigma-70 [Deltaproteobacteria bacterium RIFOXYA12_FULL_58_15]